MIIAIGRNGGLGAVYVYFGPRRAYEVGHTHLAYFGIGCPKTEGFIVAVCALFIGLWVDIAYFFMIEYPGFEEFDE